MSNPEVGSESKRDYEYDWEHCSDEDIDSSEDTCDFDDPDDVQMFEYVKHFRATDGFEIDPSKFPVPDRMIGGIRPLNFKGNKTRTRDLIKCAKFAIAEYNKAKGKELVFEKLLMASFIPCSGFVYYITFEAREFEYSPNKETYQTRVYKGIQKPLKLKLFRKKPEIYRKAKIESDSSICRAELL